MYFYLKHIIIIAKIELLKFWLYCKLAIVKQKFQMLQAFVDFFFGEGVGGC